MTRWLALAPLLLAGCPSDEGDDTNTDSQVCADEGETYAAGMEHAGDAGVYTFVLVAGDPAPPDKGDNTWTLKVLDATGGPVEGATLTIEPFMPEHGHGSTPASFDGTTAADGTVTIGPMDLFMAGTWELTLTADQGGTTDTTIFAFCLEG